MSDRAAGSVSWGHWFKWNKIGCWGVVMGSPAPWSKLDSDLRGDIWMFSEAPRHHAEEMRAGPGRPQELSMLWCWPKAASKFMQGLF